MSVRNIVIALGAAALLPLAAVAMEEAGPGGFGPHPEFGGMHHPGHGEFSFLRGVQLTDTQRTQVHQLMRESFSTHQPEMEQLHSLHKQIEDSLISTAAGNKDALMSLQKKASALRDQLDVERLETALQVKAMLTPAQLEQAASVHQKLDALHEQEHQLMGEGEPGAPPAER